jgi:hypothetical protein
MLLIESATILSLQYVPAVFLHVAVRRPTTAADWGSGSSSGSSGCCTSCCKRSFDDDDFEREETKLREQRLAREAAQAQANSEDSNKQVRSNHAANGDNDSDVVSTQPKGTQMMSEKPSTDKEPAE